MPRIQQRAASDLARLHCSSSLAQGTAIESATDRCYGSAGADERSATNAIARAAAPTRGFRGNLGG